VKDGESLLDMIGDALNLAVLFNNAPVNIMGITQLHQPFSERRVTEKLRYPGKHFQMQARGIFRREEQKEDMNRFLINGIKRYTLKRSTNNTDDVL
jgi:hypothetical protein